MTTEQKVITQLTRYRDIVGRMHVLESYNIGGGITVSRLNQDDQLQELHQKLRSMPSYMYLSKHEQKLEAIAHSYLSFYPAGTRSQLYAVKDCEPASDEDRAALKELQRKIRKVIEARTGTQEGYEAILDRLSEYQDLKAEKEKVDAVLGTMEKVQAELLRLRYVEDNLVSKICEKLAIVEKTYFRWRTKAVTQYAKLSGF